MGSRTISVTDEVYNHLVKYKGENESFSEFFTRLLDVQRRNIEEAFGAWNLTPDEEECFSDSVTRQGRRWKRLERGGYE